MVERGDFLPFFILFLVKKLPKNGQKSPIFVNARSSVH